MAYSISRVSPGDKRTMAEIDALLVREGIRRDRNLDYTCAMYDEGRRVVATGSCFGIINFFNVFKVLFKKSFTCLARITIFFN